MQQKIILQDLGEDASSLRVGVQDTVFSVLLASSSLRKAAVGLKVAFFTGVWFGSVTFRSHIT